MSADFRNLVTLRQRQKNECKCQSWWKDLMLEKILNIVMPVASFFHYFCRLLSKTHYYHCNLHQIVMIMLREREGLLKRFLEAVEL